MIETAKLKIPFHPSLLLSAGFCPKKTRILLLRPPQRKDCHTRNTSMHQQVKYSSRKASTSHLSVPTAISTPAATAATVCTQTRLFLSVSLSLSLSLSLCLCLSVCLSVCLSLSHSLSLHRRQSRVGSRPMSRAWPLKRR